MTDQNGPGPGPAAAAAATAPAPKGSSPPHLEDDRRHGSASLGTANASGREDGQRLENGYLYDSFPVYSAAHARRGGASVIPRTTAAGAPAGARRSG
ncbi:hypothetical protein E4U41_003637, partial [Claviceps citrina]